MKRYLMIAAASAACIGLAACSDNREEVLKVYNWEAYLDTSTLHEFEQAYAKETGENIRVEYTTFESYKQARHAIKVTKTDYDVLNLADYEVLEMQRDSLLQPLDHSKLAAFSTFHPMTVNNLFDPGNKFSVPYMAGATGILYNPHHRNVDRSDMRSWSALWNPKYSRQILMKGSDGYELYMVGLLYTQRNRLRALSDNETFPTSFKIGMSHLLNQHSASIVHDVIVALREQRKLIDRYVGDDGKYLLMETPSRYALGCFWTCDAVYAMKRNKQLEFVIPEEGSMFYIDSWCIPRYARNSKAAHSFIKFMSRKDIAARNMRYVGSPSAVTEATLICREALEADTAFFEGCTPEWRQMFLEAFAPTYETMRKCITRGASMAYAGYIRKVVHEAIKSDQDIESIKNIEEKYLIEE